MPHKHAKTLSTFSTSSPELTSEAIESALAAKSEWENMPFSDRAAIFLKVSRFVTLLCSAARGFTTLAERINEHYRETHADPLVVAFAGRRPRLWQVPRQDLRCYHARTGKERLAGRD